VTSSHLPKLFPLGIEPNKNLMGDFLFARHTVGMAGKDQKSAILEEISQVIFNLPEAF